MPYGVVRRVPIDAQLYAPQYAVPDSCLATNQPDLLHAVFGDGTAFKALNSIAKPLLPISSWKGEAIAPGQAMTVLGAQNKGPARLRAAGPGNAELLTW